MRFFQKAKDGGPDSKVTGYWLIEMKGLFSIVLLHFSQGTRDAYHNHAFNSMSWLLKGLLWEKLLDTTKVTYKPSLKPIMTYKDTFHQVFSVGDSWVLSFRGPWKKKWNEYSTRNGYITLTNGRKVV